MLLHSGNIRFGLLSDVDMIKLSHVQVVNKELYQMPRRTPTPNGCLDPKLVLINFYNSKLYVFHEKYNKIINNFT